MLITILSVYYNDVIMSKMASQITSLTFIQAQSKENFKAPRHWPLWGNSSVTGEFPAQRTRNAENVSIWWRHDGTVAFIWIHFKYKIILFILDIVSVCHTHCNRHMACRSWSTEYDSKNVIFNLVLLIGIFRSSHNNALRWMSWDLTYWW